MHLWKQLCASQITARVRAADEMQSANSASVFQGHSLLAHEALSSSITVHGKLLCDSSSGIIT